jgi:predicted HicB family RNase H-like nuclease
MSEYVVGKDVDLDTDDVRDSQGRKVTREYAERAAEQALDAIGRGRPSLGGRAGRSPQVTFRVTPELRAKADAEATRQGRHLSDLAREALERYLAS